MFKIKEISHLGAFTKLILISFFIGYIPFHTQSFAGQVSIGSSDLPYETVAKYDTITFSSSKITTSGSGIFVSHDSVVVDLRDDTLQFGVGYGDNLYGIKNNAGVQGMTILGNSIVDSGGLILHGGGTGASDSSWDNACIIVNDVFADFLIENVDMEIYGWDGRNVQSLDQYGADLTISGGRWINHVEGFTSRGSFDAAAIKVRIDTLIMHDVYIDCWHSAIYFSSAAATIYNCSLLVDARNDLYTYDPVLAEATGRGTASYYFTSALSAGITGWAPKPGTHIYDNTILAGIDNEGCEQGIALNYATGTPTDTIKIHGNYARLHRGPDDHYGAGLTCKGYKQRWECKYVHIYDNEFHISTHADSGAHSAAWGLHAKGFDMTWSMTGYGTEGSFVDSFIIIENNRVFIEALSAGCDAQGAEITIRGESESPPFSWTGARNIWRNNYLKSSKYGYFLGKLDAGLCDGFLIQGDTIESYGDEDYHSYRLGNWDTPSVDNIARDIVYLGGASATDIGWYPTSGSNGSDLALERTLQIYIEGNNNLPVTNAACSLWNGYNQLVYTGFSNGSGFDTVFVKYYHGFKSVPDTNYNDFLAKVGKDGHSSFKTLTIESNSGSTRSAALFSEFYLDILGTGIDTIPPGNVSDLRISPGD